MSEISPHYLIKKARGIYSQSELANILKVNETAPPAYLEDAIRQMILPLPFIDGNTVERLFDWSL